MNYKTLEKLSGLYIELKSLDAEIIKLDKTALAIAESGSMVDFQLNIIHKPKTEKVKVIDEDGSLIKDGEAGQSPMASFHNRLLAGMWSVDIGATSKVKTPEIDEQVTDITGLQIIAVLLNQKNEQRTKIVSQIKELL